MMLARLVGTVPVRCQGRQRVRVQVSMAKRFTGTTGRLLGCDNNLWMFDFPHRPSCASLARSQPGPFGNNLLIQNSRFIRKDLAWLTVGMPGAPP